MPKETIDPQAITRVPESSKILGKYELLELIGDGAEGRIFKARCIEEGVTGVSYGEAVALKRLRNTGHDQQSLLFDRQTKILRSLTHENIIRYKDSFVWREDDLDHEVYCLVTELLEGETLKSLMDRNPTGLLWANAREILQQTLLALEYASTQEKSVVHRDLKPSNIYITHQGVVKLIDFGISRPLDSGATSSAASFQGTWDYMAPDFVHQQNAFRGDEQSDIFSFGVCLYQVLTGHLPFPALGDNPQIAYFQRWYATDKLPEVEYRHPVFRVLNRAGSCIGKCLAFKRDVRYRSFKELLADFSRIQPRKLRHRTEEYEYVGYLGQGGFGQVFRARRLSDGYDTAIKEMLADRQAGRFVREAKALQHGRHPHLVEYVDFVEIEEQQLGDQRRFFLVLEYLKGMPGASLRDRIKNSESGMNPEEVMRLFTGYLDCLEHLHQKGIIHRDIKPGNLYALEGEPDNGKIFDLGIAHDEEGTRTHGQVPGTLDYMPPEFATQNSGRGSVQSDIYSIGVTLYQALTKRLPFPSLPEKESEAFIAFYQRSQNPPDCSFEHSVFTKFPELMPLFRRALAPDLTQRHESAKALRDEVRQVLGGWDSSKQKELYDAAMSAARAAWSQENYEEAEQQANRALALSPGDQVAAQVLLQVQAGKRKAGSYDGAPAAAREILSVKKSDEAEKKPEDALKLRPREATARELSSRAQKGKQEEVLFSTEIKAAQEALDTKDYEGAEKHAQEALALRPAETAATQLLLKAQEARKRVVTHQEPPFDRFVNQPSLDQLAGTEPTSPVEETEEVSTEETTPASLERIEEFQEAEEKRAQVEKEEREQAELVRREKARQVVEARKRLQDRRRRLAAAWVLGVGVVVGLCLGSISALKAWEKAAEARNREKLSNLIRQGQAAEQNKDWAAAINGFGPAVRLAEKLKDETGRQSAQRDLEFAQMMEAGERFLREKKPGEAEREADKALAQKRGDLAASDLKKRAKDMAADETKRHEHQRLMTEARQAEQRKDWIAASTSLNQALSKADELKDEKDKQEAQKELEYVRAMRASHDALDRNDYAEAIIRVSVALDAKANDPAATKLKTEAQRQLDLVNNEKALEQKYQTAMKDGQTAFNRKEYAQAITQAGVALNTKANDPAATKLRTDAQRQLDLVSNEKAQEQKYQTAMKDGQTAFNRNEYAQAITQAGVALNTKANDPAAIKLRTDAQRQLDLVNNEKAQEQKYQTAMKDGQTAFNRKEYAQAITQAGVALNTKANDPAATKLRTDAQRQLDLVNSEKAQEQKYQTAMKDGQSAFDRKEYVEAITQAGVALETKAKDPAATKLRAEAQRQLDVVNNAKAQEQKYQTAMKDGQSALDRKEYVEAITQAGVALETKANDPAATKLRTEAQRQLDVVNNAKAQEQKYQTAMKDGQTALDRKNYAEAITQAGAALETKANDPAATRLRTEAQRQLDVVNNAKAQEQKDQTAMKDGQTALDRKNYAEAITQAGAALDTKANDPAATKLRAEAQRQLDVVNNAKAQEQKYQTAMKDGQTALDRKDYAEAITQAGVALDTKANDPAATKLRTDAQRQSDSVNNAKAQEQKYETAMKDGQTALDRKNYPEAITQAGVALDTKANDPAATKLRIEAQRQLDVVNNANAQEQKYQTAMKDGQTALDRKNYAEAITQAGAALDTKANDPAATKLRTEAQRQLDVVNNANAQEQKYQTAMKDGQTALDRKDYAEAITQAGVALDTRANDPAAMKLRTDAQQRLDLVNNAKAQTTGVPTRVELAPRDQKFLEQAEFLFNLKDPPPGTKLTPLPNAKSQKTEVRRALLAGIGKIESDYKASGRLPNKELEQRLKALREAIEQWAAKK